MMAENETTGGTGKRPGTRGGTAKVTVTLKEAVDDALDETLMMTVESEGIDSLGDYTASVARSIHALLEAHRWDLRYYGLLGRSLLQEKVSEAVVQIETTLARLKAWEEGRPEGSEEVFGVDSSVGCSGSGGRPDLLVTVHLIDHGGMTGMKINTFGETTAGKHQVGVANIFLALISAAWGEAVRAYAEGYDPDTHPDKFPVLLLAQKHSGGEQIELRDTGEHGTQAEEAGEKDGA